MNRFLKKYYLYILAGLTLISGIISVSPVLQRPNSPFYVIDPDPAYVANALEYLQIHKIFILDHPGTPLIMVLSLVFLPIKIAIKLLGVTTFVEWTLRNFGTLLWLGKAVTFSLFAIGVFIIHLSVYKLFKSIFANVFLFFLLFLVPYFAFLQTIITPETIALLFTSIWFYFMTLYIRTNKYDYLAIASVFAGLATASKINFIFVTAPALIVSIAGWSSKKFRKIDGIKTLLLGVLSLSGFVLGTLPVVKNYGYIINWTLNLITKTGRTGSGSAGIANFSIFSASFFNWFGHSYIIFVFLVLLVLFFLTNKIRLFWKSILATALFGLFAFMKYPQVHYQFPNLLMLALCLTFIFSLVSKKSKLLALMILIPLSFLSAKDQLVAIRKDVLNSANIQRFRRSLPDNGFYIWQDSASEDFALERALDWSGKFFQGELKTYRPNTWILYYRDFRIIINNDRQYYFIDDFCWDGLFLGKDSWDDFIGIQKHPEGYNVVPIDGSSMLFVTQKSCSSKDLHPKEVKNLNDYGKN